jgi:uncharacterized protein YndB with AHSA1/START domain
MKPTAIKTTDLAVSRTIPASPERVYDVWLDATSPGGPWHGSKKVILDARVDGLFYHAMEWEGTTWSHYGRFIALERGRRIEHTWMSPATKGLETVVHITLEPKGDETLLSLRHTGVPDDEFGRQHAQGWTWITDALADLLGKK